MEKWRFWEANGKGEGGTFTMEEAEGPDEGGANATTTIVEENPTNNGLGRRLTKRMTIGMARSNGAMSH